MKKFILITGLLLSFSSYASVEQALQNICTIVAADDVRELRKKDRKVRVDYGLQIKDYFEGISCNGNDLLVHSQNNNSQEALSYILKKLPKSYLEENISKYSSEIQNMINERIKD